MESGSSVNIPEDLVEFISKKTGVSKKTVLKVLTAERLYYIRLMYGNKN